MVADTGNCSTDDSLAANASVLVALGEDTPEGIDGATKLERTGLLQEVSGMDIFQSLDGVANDI